MEEMDRLLDKSTIDRDDTQRARSTRRRRNPKMEDFQVDTDDFAQIRQYWSSEFDQDTANSGILRVQQDYFGDYEGDEKPRKRSYRPDSLFLTYHDLVRIKRDLESQLDEELDSENQREKREKREQEEPACNSEVTTLTVGCSTADRMEFQSDCVDEDAITGEANFTNKIFIFKSRHP